MGRTRIKKSDIDISKNNIDIITNNNLIEVKVKDDIFIDTSKEAKEEVESPIAETTEVNKVKSLIDQPKSNDNIGFFGKIKSLFAINKKHTKETQSSENKLVNEELNKNSTEEINSITEHLADKSIVEEYIIEQSTEQEASIEETKTETKKELSNETKNLDEDKKTKINGSGVVISSLDLTPENSSLEISSSHENVEEESTADESITTQIGDDENINLVEEKKTKKNGSGVIISSLDLTPENSSLEISSSHENVEEESTTDESITTQIGDDENINLVEEKKTKKNGSGVIISSLDLTPENSSLEISSSHENVEEESTTDESITTQIGDDENINLVEEIPEKKGFFSKIFARKKSLDNSLNTQKIIDFNGALKGISFYIATQNWVKAKLGIEEIEIKESNAYNSLIRKINIDKERIKQQKIYDKKIKEITKLKDTLVDKERRYFEKREVEKLKVKFIQVKATLTELIGLKKNYEALDLINGFFEENKNVGTVVKFYDRWRKKIQKNIDKKLKEDAKKATKNARAEAYSLIGEKTSLLDKTEEKIEIKKNSFFIKKIVDKFNLYKKIRKILDDKKILDEVTLLIESENEISEAAKKKKLENMHVGLIKEIDNNSLIGFDFYAKILGKDKISGDSFGFSENKENYKFFLGDATGHGVQAGLVITLLTRLFHNFSGKNILEKVVFEINNGLKQDLKSRNFITGIFFEVEKDKLDTIRYIGMGHEPILVYRNKTKVTEKILAGGLAAGIRIMTNLTQIKSRFLKVEEGDIVMIYSDGIVEARNLDNQLLGIDGLLKIFENVCSTGETNNHLIYDKVIEEVKRFKGGNSNFTDDASILIIKRNSSRDIVDRKSQYLKDLSVAEGLSNKNLKELEGKTKEEVEKELEKIRKEKEILLIINNLDNLLLTGEILKLKQEAIRYIKNGFIHKKINWYLKKAIANERKYKIDLKDQKMKTKYKVLKELLKKGDYNTVIREINEIISNDGNINI